MERQQQQQQQQQQDLLSPYITTPYTTPHPPLPTPDLPKHVVPIVGSTGEGALTFHTHSKSARAIDAAEAQAGYVAPAQITWQMDATCQHDVILCTCGCGLIGRGAQGMDRE